MKSEHKRPRVGFSVSVYFKMTTIWVKAIKIELNMYVIFNILYYIMFNILFMELFITKDFKIDRFIEKILILKYKAVTFFFNNHFILSFELED